MITFEKHTRLRINANLWNDSDIFGHGLLPCYNKNARAAVKSSLQLKNTFLGSSRAAMQFCYVLWGLQIRYICWWFQPTLWKNMSSSIGMITFPTEWKNKIHAGYVCWWTLKNIVTFWCTVMAIGEKIITTSTTETHADDGECKVNYPNMALFKSI